MQIYLDSYGATLKVENNMFWLKSLRQDAKKIPIKDVNAIFLTKGVMVSSDAMLLAIKNDIPILLIDGIGHFVGQVWGGKYGSIATIRKQQALLATQKVGLLWIRDLLGQKLEQQKALIIRWSERGVVDGLGVNMQVIDAGLRVIYNMRQRFLNLKIDDIETWDKTAGSFRGWEGTASRHYFACLSACLPSRYQFERRSARPALDSFNALLNYLYGILYAQVHLALMKAGLDPYLGILHTDQYNRPTLVYDVIEIYRHWAEDLALWLCWENRLPDDAFVLVDERTGVWLSEVGKPIVVKAFFLYLDEVILYQNLSRKRITHIDLDAQRWANALKRSE